MTLNWTAIPGTTSYVLSRSTDLAALDAGHHAGDRFACDDPHRRPTPTPARSPPTPLTTTAWPPRMGRARAATAWPSQRPRSCPRRPASPPPRSRPRRSPSPGPAKPAVWLYPAAGNRLDVGQRLRSRQHFRLVQPLRRRQPDGQYLLQLPAFRHRTIRANPPPVPPRPPRPWSLPPVVTSVAGSTTSNVLSWTAVTGATGYVLRLHG